MPPKKVFIYGGIRNEESQLMKYLQRLKEELLSQQEDVRCDLFSAAKTHIHHSTGCKNCFEKGYCEQDNLPDDDMNLIKKKMLAADFIILASPVYSHNVSADMKALIDRLSYWAHLFRLNGKPGAVIVSASTNGAELVEEYLSKVSRYMGIIVVDRTSIFTIDTEQEKENKLRKTLRTVLEYLNGVKIAKTNEDLEASFATMKFLMLAQPKDQAEFKYRHDNRLFECDSFQEYIDRLKENPTPQAKHI